MKKTVFDWKPLAVAAVFVFSVQAANAQITGVAGHNGINNEIAGAQRIFFEAIEEEITEAVEYQPWQDASKPGVHRVFAAGFEKTSSGDIYKIGSRGIMAGIHRLVFDGKLGVGIAGAASFLETAGQPVSEEAEGFHGTLYAKFRTGIFSASAAASLGLYEYESSETDEDANKFDGKTDVKIYGAKFSAGLEVLKNLPLRIKPEASVAVSEISADPYSVPGVTEGTGVSVEKNSAASFETGAKIRVAFNALKVFLQTVVQPEIEAGINYDFSSEDGLKSVSSADEVLERAQKDQLRWSLGGKIILSDNKHLALKIGYKTDFIGKTRSHSGAAQFHIRF